MTSYHTEKLKEALTALIEDYLIHNLDREPDGIEYEKIVNESDAMHNTFPELSCVEPWRVLTELESVIGIDITSQVKQNILMDSDDYTFRDNNDWVRKSDLKKFIENELWEALEYTLIETRMHSTGFKSIKIR